MFKKGSYFLFAIFFSFIMFSATASAAVQYNCICVDGSSHYLGSCIECTSTCSTLGGKISCGQVGDFTTDKAAEASANGSATVKLDNPLGSVTTPQVLIGKIINSVLGVVGSLALLMFIFGGLTWMTSAGSADKVKKGKDIIVWSAIGLVVIFASYGLVRFLILNIR